MNKLLTIVFSCAPGDGDGVIMSDLVPPTASVVRSVVLEAWRACPFRAAFLLDLAEVLLPRSTGSERFVMPGWSVSLLLMLL